MINGKIQLVKKAEVACTKFTLICSTQQAYTDNDFNDSLCQFYCLCIAGCTPPTAQIDGVIMARQNERVLEQMQTQAIYISSGLINTKERLCTKYITLSRAKYIHLLTRVPFHMTGVLCHYVKWAILTFQQEEMLFSCRWKQIYCDDMERISVDGVYFVLTYSIEFKTCF